MVSVGCDIRHTSSVMHVLSYTVLNAEVRDACVQVDIHDLLAYRLPDTFSCFHGVLVSSMTDEIVIEQLAVTFDGQGQVGDGNILLTDSSQLVSDLLVSDVKTMFRKFVVYFMMVVRNCVLMSENGS